MLLSRFPFMFFGRLLTIPTLSTKIRQKTWDLDNLIPAMRKTKSHIRRLMGISKPAQADVQGLKDSLIALASEIEIGIKHLKYISFYNSALFYLYYRLLIHLHDLCEREEKRLREENDKASHEFKKAKKGIKIEVKSHERTIRRLKIAEEYIIRDYEDLVKQLNKRRWDAEKQAQHEFRLLQFTFRGFINLNRKIKVAAIRVKKQFPKQQPILDSIKRKNYKNIDSSDIVRLSKIIFDVIKNIGRDVVYAFMLISKFEKEMGALKQKVDKLKSKHGIKEDLIKECENKIIEAEQQFEKDLKNIFDDFFVEYKYIGTRPISRAA